MGIREKESLCCTVEYKRYSRIPLIRTLVIQIINYPDLLSLSFKFVKNSTKLTSLEITGYQIKYSTMLRLLGLQMRRGRKV
jgi:ribosomal protein S18